MYYDTALSRWCVVDDAGSGGSGEVNTASNLGAGTGIFASKVGVDLQFKSLANSTGSDTLITWSASGTEITLQADLVFPIAGTDGPGLAYSFDSASIAGSSNAGLGMDQNVQEGPALFDINGDAQLVIDTSGVTIPGKLTVTGLIDPTGLELTPVAANPGGVAANTLWLDSTASNVLKHGANRVMLGSNNLSEVTNAATARSNIGAGTASITGTYVPGNLVKSDGAGNLEDAGFAPASVYRSGGTDVPITDGGTGASDADGAINNIVSAATNRTPALADRFPFEVASHASQAGAATFQQTLNLIGSLTEEHAVSVNDDSLAVYDSSGAATDRATVGSVLGAGSQANDFRLTGASGTPVMTTDSTSISTLYLSPYSGNRISLYDTTNSKWVLRQSAEVSLAVTGRTTDLPFDVFAYWTGSAVALEFLNWTNATTRATALARQDGIWTKSGDASRRYVGTVRPRSATSCHWVLGTADSPAKLDIDNADNRVAVRFSVRDTTNTWTYSTATYRQARASANNQVDIMVGLADRWVDMRASGISSNSSGGQGMWTAVGYDSTTAFVAGCITGVMVSAAGAVVSGTAHTAHAPAVGTHYYAWLERGSGTGTTTWHGDNGGTDRQSGMTGTWWC